MEDFYLYTLQVNVALLVFYILYRVLFSRDTFLEIRRMFLFTVIFLAFTYPLVSLAAWIEQQQPLQTMMVSYAELLTVTVAAVALAKEEVFFTWQNVIILLWGGGVVFLLIRMLIQLFIVFSLSLKGKKINWNGTVLVALERETAPFSFFSWIFVNPAYHDEKELHEIVAHEKAHVRQWHSVDMLLGELLCIFFWFNPAIWLLRSEIRQNLEFLADKDVVRSGYNRKNYQYHLLRLSYQAIAVQIVNNFNVTQLKKRIIMMNKKKTSKIGLFKYALLLPMTGLLILTGNAQVVAEVAENIVVGQVSVNKEFTIKGQVMDENGKPVHGVNVIIKDSNVGSVTDPKGNFSVKFDKPGVLLFSYVGKKTESIAFTQETTDVKITMKADFMQLEGIVVVGYSGEGNSTIKDKESGEIFVVVEDMPQFPGGNIQKFLAKNVKYPVVAQEKGIWGRVFVSFVVDKTGKVVQAKVIKSVDPSLDEEALRVIGLMPLWKPGKQRGMPVDVQYTLPIDFFLQKAGESIMTVGTVNTFEATGLNDSTVSVTKNSMTKISVRGYKNSVTHSYSTPKVDSTKMPGGVSTDNRVTFSVKEKPLYIVDGKKMPESFNMNDMPTETVKQITVLKGDTAVVIYGEEGRSGVVVVTTEKED